MRTWADDFNTYDEACRFYGCDTPAQVAAECEQQRREELIEMMDDMEAKGRPIYTSFDFEFECPF